MNNHEEKHPQEEWGAMEHALTGAGVGAAGIGNSVALIGLSAGLAALPVSIVIGVAGGLVWWGVRALAKKL
jgi:hypothetical protein